jgi:aminoglycoside 6-adenylyltransferase
MLTQSLLPVRGQLLQNILEWGSACPEIRGLVMVGSGARSDHPADEWSDIDLVLITTNPTLFLQSSDWLKLISEPWIATVEKDPHGNTVERRVLFRNGIDIDFMVLGSDRLAGFQEAPLSEIIQRGMRILLDKDDVLVGVRKEQPEVNSFHTPSVEEFSEVVSDFWFHTVWAAKKIKRGELWTAKSCCDMYLKKLLLTMLECQVRSRDGSDTETWYNGRFIETWVSDRVLERLQHAFAHYDENDIWQALLNTMELFDQIGKEIARQFKYPYPDFESKSITDWLVTLRTGSGSIRIGVG